MVKRITKWADIEIAELDLEKLMIHFAQSNKSDREIAVALNVLGYRTSGTHGPRPCTKSTVKNILVNKFYLGYIPNGNDGWLETQHEPLIAVGLFETVQEMRSMAKLPRQTINTDARTYRLSCISRCARCGREGIRPNVYYAWLRDFMEAGKTRLAREPFATLPVPR